MRSAAGLLAWLLVGCTFESASAQQPPLEVGETDAPVSATSSGDTTSGPPAGTTSTLTSQGELDDTGDPASSGALSTSSSSSGDPAGTTDEEGSSTSGPSVDCTTAITLTQTAGEATLFKPMQLGSFQGSQYAFSEIEGSGEVRFTFEVACPSTYRLFGRVRDDSPGTGNDDPDSFDLEGPNGLQHSWFYGCDTVNQGWNWAQVEAGEGVGSCAEPPGVMVRLSAGSHVFTLRNREPAEGGAHAGIAQLVLTNDQTYTP